MAEVPARHNLPQATKRFFGRHDQAKEIKERLCESRIVSITGYGGVGKTSLALRVGHEVLTDFDAVHYAAAYAGASPDSIAGLFQFRCDAAPAFGLAKVVAAIGESEALVILDACQNAEQACKDFCTEILNSCAQTRILAAGRSGLGIENEVVLCLAGMHMPPLDTSSVQDLLEYDSARLFIEHYCSDPGETQLSSADIRSIAFICNSLRGFPLAIEVAAAHARNVGLQEVADLFREGLREEEVHGISDLLGETIRWSCFTLSERSRARLYSLAVFEGGFDSCAASAVCDLSPDEMRETLEELLEARLLVVGWSCGEGIRYELPKAVSEYVRNVSPVPDDHRGGEERHAHYYLTVAQEARCNLHGGNQSAWFHRCREEHGNIVKAISYYFGQPAMQPSAGEFFKAIGDVWIRTGPMDIACEYAQRVAGWTKNRNEQMQLSSLLNVAGAIFLTAGRSDQADHVLHRALLESENENDALSKANVFSNLAIVAMQKSDLDQALNFSEHAIQVYRETNEERRLATSLTNHGALLGSAKRFDEAFATLSEAMTTWERLGNSWATSWTRIMICELALETGQVSFSARESVKCLREGLVAGDQRLVRLSLDVLALIAEKQGQLEIAATFLGGGDNLADRHGVLRSCRFREHLGSLRESLREALGPSKSESLLTGSKSLCADDLLQMAEEILIKC